MCMRTLDRYWYIFLSKPSPILSIQLLLTDKVISRWKDSRTEAPEHSPKAKPTANDKGLIVDSPERILSHSSSRQCFSSSAVDDKMYSFVFQTLSIIAAPSHLKGVMLRQSNIKDRQSRRLSRKSSGNWNLGRSVVDWRLDAAGQSSIRNKSAESRYTVSGLSSAS